MTLLPLKKQKLLMTYRAILLCEMMNGFQVLVLALFSSVIITGQSIAATKDDNKVLPTHEAYTLSQKYFSGSGVDQDTRKAVSLIVEAANGGSGEAQYTLGKLYDEGIGLEKDNILAYVWYSIAAENWASQLAIENRNWMKDILSKNQLIAADIRIEDIKKGMSSIHIWEVQGDRMGVEQTQSNLKLTIRCNPRTNVFFEYTDGSAPAYFNVALLDDEVNVNQSWGPGLRTAYNANDSRLEYEGNVSQFLLKLLSAHEMIIGIASLSGADTYTFDLNSLAIPFNSLSCGNIDWFKSRVM